MYILIEALTNTPALYKINSGENKVKIVLTVDGSGEGWEAILQPIDSNSTRHSIRYESSLWTEAEKKYNAGKREYRT